MKQYLVIKIWNHDGSVTIVKPDYFLTLDEAKALCGMFSRTDPDHTYAIVSKLD